MKAAGPVDLVQTAQDVLQRAGDAAQSFAGRQGDAWSQADTPSMDSLFGWLKKALKKIVKVVTAPVRWLIGLFRGDPKPAGGNPNTPDPYSPPPPPP
ncbi:MAG: hypothetical protein AAB576_09370, partial [Elusimicrobiota bacterium]